MPLDNLDIDTRLGLLQKQDFVDYALGQGMTPHEALGLPDVLPRSQSCVRPIVLDRISEDGELAEIQIPCGTANAIKCASCADFMSRLRQRQILNGFETSNDRTRVALFTNTAPSFGQVHRASITAKDDYKVRLLNPGMREKALLIASRQKGACNCGKYHRHDELIVGTPINASSYGYVREIIWSENLPALVKSMTRKLRYIARSLGIEDKQMGLFTVFERQKRGSLHAHMLVSVRDDPAAFDLLAKEIKTGWGTRHIPTAKIADYRLNWYRSPVVAERWRKYLTGFMPGKFDIDRAIPRASWKNGGVIPATQFGEIWDWREVSGNRNLDGEQDGNDGFKQAGAYVAKYLTKNQQATAPEALAQLKGQQRLHFQRLRAVSAVLLLDRVILEGTISALERELAETESDLKAHRELLALIPAADSSVPDLFRHIELAEEHAASVETELFASLLALENPAPQSLFVSLFSKDTEYPGSFDAVNEHQVRSNAKTWGQGRAAKGLSIRINKVMDNAGFTGSLVSISHWGTTLQSLKDEMQSFARLSGDFDPDAFEYSLNPERMGEIRRVRAGMPEFPKMANVERILGAKLIETREPPERWREPTPDGQKKPEIQQIGLF